MRTTPARFISPLNINVTPAERGLVNAYVIHNNLTMTELVRLVLGQGLGLADPDRLGMVREAPALSLRVPPAALVKREIEAEEVRAAALADAKRTAQRASYVPATGRG
jgi:hypothetical protein